MTYPDDGDGVRVPHESCQPIGEQAHDDGLDGIDCRSAATLDGVGRGTAWWSRGRTCEPIDRGRRIPYGGWRDPRTDDVDELLGQQR